MAAPTPSRSVSFATARTILLDLYAASAVTGETPVSVGLIGPPGAGKSAFVNALAETLGHTVVFKNIGGCDPADIGGICMPVGTTVVRTVRSVPDFVLQAWDAYLGASLYGGDIPTELADTIIRTPTSRLDVSTLTAIADLLRGEGAGEPSEVAPKPKPKPKPEPKSKSKSKPKSKSKSDADADADHEDLTQSLGFNPVLVFFDEFSTAPPSIQNLCLTVLNEGHVHGFYLPPMTWRVLAANSSAHGAAVFTPPTTITSRVAFIHVAATSKEWLDHARKAGYLHPAIEQFVIDTSPAHDVTQLPDAKSAAAADSFPTPRTLEHACRVLHYLDKLPDARQAKSEARATQSLIPVLGPRAAAAVVSRRDFNTTGTTPSTGAPVVVQVAAVFEHPDKTPLPSPVSAYPLLVSALIQVIDSSCQLMAATTYCKRMGTLEARSLLAGVHARRKDLVPDLGDALANL